MEFSSEYINDIKEKIKERTGMSDVELQREIDAVVKELEFLSPEAAVMQIARKFGIETEEIGAINPQEYSVPILAIADIVEHEVVQPSISVQGIVLRVYRPLEIRSRLNPSEPNTLARVLLGDGTSSLMVLLWPPHATMILSKEITRGTPVRLRRVASKKNPRSGRVEIHTTASSEIEIVPELLQNEHLPNPDDLIYLPSDLIRLVREQGSVDRLKEFDVLGVVVANYGVRTFTKANQEQGQYGQVIIKDRDASVRVLFWEDRSVDSQDLNVGDIMFFEGVTLSVNPRSSASFQQDVDLTVHVNKLANVTKLEENSLESIPHAKALKALDIRSRVEVAMPSETSSQPSSPSSISDITLNQGNVRLRARVKKVFPSRSFVRRDGTEGYVTRALIHDGKAGIILVAWDEMGKILETCHEGMILDIQGARARSSRNGDLLEVHVDNNGRLTKITEEMEENFEDSPETDLTPVTWDELSSHDGKIVTLRGIVRNVFDEHVFERSGGGGQGKNRVLILRDEDDNHRARVVVWNEKVDELSGILDQLQAGDEIEITWAKVKVDERYEGTMNLHLRPESEIHVIYHGNDVSRGSDENASQAFSALNQSSTMHDHESSLLGDRSIQHHLNGLTKGQTIECRAIITKINSRRPYYLSCPRDDCQKKLTNSEADSSSVTSSLTCPVHGLVSSPEVKLVISGQVDDGTAQCAFVGFGKVSEMLLNEELVSRLREIALVDDEENTRSEIEQWLQKVRTLVLGKQFVLKGYVVESRQAPRMSLDSNFSGSMSPTGTARYQVILTWISPLDHEETFSLIAQQLI